MEPDLTPPAPLRRPVLAWSLAALAFALAGVLGWKLLHPAGSGDPVATSLLAFEKQNRLTVFSAQLAPVVAADDERLFGMLKSRQVAVIPARVDYTIDFAGMNASRLDWDKASRRLSITLPPLRLSKPNLDEAHAQYLREGVWITRDAQASLTRENTLLAERLAARQATNPALLELARSAARDAVRQNLAIPLEVAGYGAVTVQVRFENEPAPAS